MSALKFSPSGRHFAVAVGRRLQLWQTPSTPGTETNGEIEFAPFVLHRDLAGHFDDIQNIEWSSDSRFLLTASKDLTARVWSLDPEDGFEPTTLSGHRYGVVCAWFDANQELVSSSLDLSSFCHIRLISQIDLHCQSGWCSFPLGVPHEEGLRNRRGYCIRAMEDYQKELFHAE